MPLPIYYVGAPAEVEHHARPLFDQFDVRIVDCDEVVQHARAGDLCLFFNEFLNRFRVAHHELMRRGCATLYAIDGILEWRSMWEFPPGDACAWTARPILSHKVACIGRSQARVFESWGHGDQCEVVGVPRFDRLLGRVPRTRRHGEPFTIMVLTAKWPGFTPEQWARASRSLKDLKRWLETHPVVYGTPVRSVWRITQGLESEVGVDNSLRDTTGQDLAAALAQADAVVTTPSTAMLEGMLQGVPVALLDYNNCPHYVPAAWRITAGNHFEQVIPELVRPPEAKRHYQQHLLQDSLECSSPATPRMVTLIAEMDAIAKHAVATGAEMKFPPRLLRERAESWPTPAVPSQSDQLFVGFPSAPLSESDRLALEVSDLRQALAAATHTINQQRETLTWFEQRILNKGLKRRLKRMPEKLARAVRRLVVRSDNIDGREQTLRPA
jgi:hypothetical protein